MSKVKLTLVERTMLANQYRILAKLGENEASNILNAEILENGYTGKYHKALLIDEEISEEICKETTDILQMFRVIKNSFARLPKDHQDGLDMEVIAFEGFDNHESHFHYASFMIDSMNLWSEHKEMYLDSHTGASIRKYRNMLNVYNQRYGKPDYDLSADTLQEIINSVQN